jgi:hypothetical protein
MTTSFLGMPLPTEIGREQEVVWSGDEADERIVILGQAFDRADAQENLAAACRHLIRWEGMGLIAVEGAAGQIPVDPAWRGLSARELMLRSEVSAGVVSLLASGDCGAEVVGVDVPALAPPSQGARARVLRHADLRDRVWGEIERLRAAARERCYPLPEVRALRAAPESLSPSERVELIRRAAAAGGVDLAGYPLLRHFDHLFLQEKTIDWKHAERERMLLVERLTGHLPAALDLRRNRVHRKRARPLLAHWMRALGMASDELEEHIARRGIAAVLAECDRWTLGWLVEGAQGSRSGRIRQTSFIQGMLDLARQCGISADDLADFRRYTAYLEEAEVGLLGGLRELLQEIVEISRDLAESGGPQAGRLRDLEDRIDFLAKALRVEMTPEDAELADLSPGAVPAVLEGLAALAGEELAPAWREAAEGLAPALRDARLFFDLSRRRGEAMARRTLELLRERGEDRALLVVGGFHTLAVRRALERERRVSWSMIFPNLDPGLAPAGGAS